ncbi:hypothetical protein K438DRAFT_1776447 [Mycena galopus ATCC 62051]|nr:hypothetical protein K438DRAFT_1776447 [Mycena galopus ATCC 62051]
MTHSCIATPGALDTACEWLPRLLPPPTATTTRAAAVCRRRRVAWDEECPITGDVGSAALAVDAEPVNVREGDNARGQVADGLDPNGTYTKLGVEGEWKAASRRQVTSIGVSSGSDDRIVECCGWRVHVADDCVATLWAATANGKFSPERGGGCPERSSSSKSAILDSSSAVSIIDPGRSLICALNISASSRYKQRASRAGRRRRSKLGGGCGQQLSFSKLFPGEILRIVQRIIFEEMNGSHKYMILFERR